MFTAFAALAALLTVRQGRHETLIAREALEAETQPLLTDVPRGVFTEEREWHNQDGTISMRRHDRSEVDVGSTTPAVAMSRNPCAWSPSPCATWATAPRGSEK